MRKTVAFLLALAMSACLGGCDDKPASETSAPIVSAEVETSTGAVQTEATTQNGEITTEEETPYMFDASYLPELRAANVGSYVKFGRYEQDNDLTNGAEDIEWLVLAKDDEKMLVISRYALDCQPYNTEFGDVTWETCSLREWLEESFIDVAFTVDEGLVIPRSTVTADKNPKYDTPAGNDTSDRVFLLSIDEVEKYLYKGGVDKNALKCEGTPYCYAQGATKGDHDTCWWWLRTPGSSADRVTGVHFDENEVQANGLAAADKHNAVRPAMWLILKFKVIV